MQNKYNVDLHKLLMKITYTWLVYAILFPSVCVIAAYMIAQRAASDQAPPLPFDKEYAFAGFLALSLIELAGAHFFRNYLLKRPMITSEYKFKKEFESGVFSNFVIVSAAVCAVALYGLFYFFMFERNVKVVMLFAIISVIGFQLFRIREGFLDKALKIQEDHVSAGRFGRPVGSKSS